MLCWRRVNVTQRCALAVPACSCVCAPRGPQQFVESASVGVCLAELQSLEYGEVRAQYRLRAAQCLAVAVDNASDAVEITDDNHHTQVPRSHGPLMPSSHRPPDATRQCYLCRVRWCELSRPDHPTCAFSDWQTDWRHQRLTNCWSCTAFCCDIFFFVTAVMCSQSWLTWTCFC